MGHCDITYASRKVGVNPQEIHKRNHVVWVYNYRVKKTPLKRKKGFTRKAPRPKKQKAPSITKLKKRLWTLCRDITRARYGYQCFTCGNFSEAPHTGHFISSSVCSVALRYHLSNLRPQCYRCNIHLSGNWLAFERKLRDMNGDVYVEELKDLNYATKGLQYDSLWYQAKISEYEKILTALLASR